MPELATNAEWRKIMVQARKDHGLTQDQLGAKVGLSQVMISKLESGESGSSTYVLRICRVLAIPQPMHFADEQSKAWNELGHVLRHRNPEQYEATRQLIETIVRQFEQAANPPITERPERRKS